MRGEKAKTIELPGMKTHRNELITLGDLDFFREQLLSDIRQLLRETTGQSVKKWLKSFEVLKLLCISKGTLQTLRNNRTLPFTRIGGVIYYDIDDIKKLMISAKAS